MVDRGYELAHICCRFQPRRNDVDIVGLTCYADSTLLPTSNFGSSELHYNHFHNTSN